MGVVVGFIIAGILFPRMLSTDEIGLLKLIVSFSVLFSQLGSLGFQSVINRLFPYFRDKNSGHNGFLTISLVITIIGFLIAFGVFECLKPILIRNNIKDSTLFAEYIQYLLPLIFFTLFFNTLDSYNKAIYDAVLGAFIKEFIQRILILIALLSYFFNLIDIHFFIQLYILSLSMPALILLFILIYRREFRIKFPNKKLLSRKMIREMINLSIFGIISGFSTMAIINIDSILVNKFMGLSATGIYATNYFFATLVIIPSRTLIKISTTIIADSWKSNDPDNILLVYKKSVINQGLISMLIFIGLWVNINNIYRIIPNEYSEGKWVIFFMSLANVVLMSSGVSGTIILTSRYYKVQTFFILIFLSLIVGLNFILIPTLGLTGAALATTFSAIIFTGIRFAFVFKKFGMNPYSLNFLVLLAISALSYLMGHLIPEFQNYIIDIIIRSSVVLIIFVSLIIKLKISEDVNSLIIYLMNKLFQKNS